MAAEHITFKGLAAVRFVLPTGDSVVASLHGGQVLSWVPADGGERLFLSEKTVFGGDAAVRGGVPVCFPQFNQRGPLPKHGFARQALWTLGDSHEDGFELLLRDGPATHAIWPERFELRLRVSRFGEAFRQIVAAQFWIATFNTCLTAIFLLVIMPAFSMRLPYTGVLIALTFIAGMIPIVGNLLCNIVLTIVGLSVSPLAAGACLIFLITIHKAEYVINAKVVGQKTHMAVWELLCVMFIAEAVFGPAGLVAAPLFYAYLKKELAAARLI